MAGEKPTTNTLDELLRQVQQQKFEPVEVVGGEIITGDVQLADGTKLRVRVVVTQVSKVVTMTGPGGRPLYSIETSVVPTVLDWRK